MKAHLLVVDWDFFFRSPNGAPPEGQAFPGEWQFYDWGHAETAFFIHGVWGGRAAGFLANGMPLPDTTGEEVGFWDRFKIARWAPLFYGDSNALAVHMRVYSAVRYSRGSVWLFDAHHDTGYYKDGPNEEQALSLAHAGVYHCDDWMVLYWAVGKTLHVRYPRWRAWAMEAEPEPLVPVRRAVDTPRRKPPVRFDAVFVCRSGAWVPPWNDLDRRFLDFVDAAPVQERICLEEAGREALVRPWDPADARAEVEMRRELLGKMPRWRAQ